MKEKGFSLLEISFVLVIVSLIMVTAIKSYNIYVEKQYIENTKSLLLNIDQAIKNFPNLIEPTTTDPVTGLGGDVYARLPCPDADNDGREDCGSGIVRGRRYNGSPNGPHVIIGELPYITLGLARDTASDPYGNKIIYAVTKSATESSSYGNGIGAIKITDHDGHESNTNQYAFLSTGRLGCSQSGLDAENCDGDADFIAAFNNDAVNYYDDRVAYNGQLPILVYDGKESGCEQYDAVTIYGESCPDGWNELGTELETVASQSQYNINDFGLTGHEGDSPTFYATRKMPKRFFNVDETSGDYYLTSFPVPGSFNEDVRINRASVTAGVSPEETITCEKPNNQNSKTRCFKKQVTAGGFALNDLDSYLADPREEKYEELNSKYCPEGFKIIDVSIKERVDNSSVGLLGSVICGQ